MILSWLRCGRSSRRTCCCSAVPIEQFKEARNYQTLPEFLMARIRDLNQQLADLRQSENQLTAQKAQLEQAAAERTQQFEQAQKKATEDLMAEREKFNQDRARLEQEKMAIASQLAEKDTSIAGLQTGLDELKQTSGKQVSDLEKIVDEQRNEIKQQNRQSFEVPDAEITSVLQNQGVLYINVGSADNLRKMQTFSVYDKRQAGVMEARSKGRVRVTRILRDHLAECEILEDDIADIIVPGDVVFTPAWSPGQKIHFAFAGLIDVTGNGRSDAQLLEEIIRSNGGVIDDEVTPQTRYLVRGADKSGIPGQPELTNEGRAEFNQKIRASQQIGVDQLSVDKLLALMGWRAEVQAVSFREEGLPDAPAEGDDNGATPFRKRAPPRGDNGAF